MAQRSFAEDVAVELGMKAAIWGPAIAGTVLLGPLGILAGLAVSAVILTGGGGGNQSPPPPDNASKEGGGS
jgi:hypothetical protein